MQKAIENFINEEMFKGEPLNKIKVEIDKVEAAALQKARKKQRIEWRKQRKLAERR